MSSTSHHSRQPRRGQALLLAVLIMIFAALLSASFIAVVSVNLNQTARQTDKNRSVVAARAGLDHVRLQLAYSADGDKWRNELENVPPAPGDADYAFYYTPMEIAQGWARVTPHPGDTNGNGIANDPEDERLALIKGRAKGNVELVKSPDPRTINAQVGDAPTFLSQVERVPFNSGTEEAGALKITVVGLSNEDPTAYTRSVAYFGGHKNAPIAQTMIVVGNWDFKNNVVPVGQVESYAPATLEITLKNVTGVFPLTDNTLNAPATANPNPPFAVMIGDPITNVAVRPATVVKRVGNVLTLSQAPTTIPSLNERVELSATIGAPTGIDYNNDNVVAPTEAVDFKVSDPTYNPANPLPTPTPQPGGTRVNGGLWWEGTVEAEAIGGTKITVSNPIPAAVQSSGMMALTQTSASVSLTGPGFTGPGIGPATLVDSKNANFPGTGAIWPASATDKDNLVSDGWNLLRGTITDNTRNISNFQPPLIDSGNAAERYRNLTRFSKPNPFSINGNSPTARQSLEGYGEGVYIDNFQDKERKQGTGTTPVEMTQSEYVKMLFGSPTAVAPSNYERVGAPVLSTNAAFANASLEEQHLRGWVGPDEFRARGVEIELANSGATPVIIVTRDARDDNKGGTINAFGPVAEKAWKKVADGTTDTGVYRKVLPWPANGVIFAEGNVRIKGQALNAPRSLTVVSMNNIYIEDSLSADDTNDGVTNGQPRKILLLARNNVVMNPTRALGRPDAQTTSTNASPVAVAVGGPATLPVADSSEFRNRDFIETSSAPAGVDTLSSTGQITAINSPTSITVAITSAPAAQVVFASSVRTRTEKTIAPAIASAAPFNVIRDSYKVIGASEDAIQRRFTVPALAPNLRIAFNHGADRIRGMNVKTDRFGTNGEVKPASGIFLSNKRVLDAAAANFVSTATRVAETNKRIRGDYDSPAPAGTDPFPAAALTTEPLAQAQDLTAMKREMEIKTHLGPPNVGWKYTVTPVARYANTPFFYLAGIGNRYDFGSTSPPALTPGAALIGWRDKIDKSDIAATAAGYDMPLATSIGMWLNGPSAPSPFTNENLTGTTYDRTASFGFDPNFLDTTSSPNQEDILTADQGFYQTAAATDPIKSTLDSRAFVIPVVVGENSLTLRQNALAPAFVTPAVLPDYRLLDMKLENVTLTPSLSSTNKIDPGHNFNVNAFVYAQTGSWLIIPGPVFEPRLHGDSTQSFFDLTSPAVTPAVADPGEYLDMDGSGTYTAGDFADLNRNGLLEDSEKYAMVRYSRFNYSISFLGAIAENQTALVNDVGTTAKGEVKDWMNKWATTSFDSAATTRVTNNRIHYVFDPTVVLNGFQQDDPSTTSKDETDYGFRLPQTPEIFNVS